MIQWKLKMFVAEYIVNSFLYITGKHMCVYIRKKTKTKVHINYLRGNTRKLTNLSKRVCYIQI